MNNKEYNGWTNYETWNVALWIDNEEPSHLYWREAADDAWRNASEGLSAYAKFTGKEIFSRKERAVLELEKRLKAEIEEQAPDLGASMWADLLGAALSEVNWHEIAGNMIDTAESNAPVEETATEDSK